MGTTAALAEIGRNSGQSAEEYLRSLIEGEILSRRSCAEILEPIRRGFDESGLSVGELDAVLGEARHARYRESSAQRRK